jgi:uncharacterized protein YjbJ (UPF0337 family)
LRSPSLQSEAWRGFAAGTPFAEQFPSGTSEQSMNWDRIEGQWKQLKGKAITKWGKLTDDDWDVIEGKRESLVGRVQELYGKRKDEAEREVDEWSRGLN